MKFELEVPEEKLKETVLCTLANMYYRDYSSDRNHVNRIVSECVRQIIYKDKERIIDRIVEQASRECKSKAIKRILEGLE